MGCFLTICLAQWPTLILTLKYNPREKERDWERKKEKKTPSWRQKLQELKRFGELFGSTFTGCFLTICWAQWPTLILTLTYNPREKERETEREREKNSILKAEAAASLDLNQFGVLSDRTKVAFALLTFAHLTFALLSHSHCCLFALLAFALLASHWCRSHFCLSHCCRDTNLFKTKLFYLSTPKNKFGACWGHKESFLKIWGKSSEKPFF